MDDEIWYRDINGFMQVSKLPEFIPLAHMTLAQKLNAILRFSIYFGLVIAVVKQSIAALFLPIFVAIFTYALFAFFDSNTKKENEMYTMLGLKKDGPGKRAPLCVAPTVHNPMGNILISDYVLNPKRPAACDITKRSVRRQAEKMFASTLYRDVDDVWTAKTSSRNFYQTPIQTIPNKQTEFAEWLYKPRGKTCKENNGVQCLNNMHRDIKA